MIRQLPEQITNDGLCFANSDREWTRIKISHKDTKTQSEENPGIAAKRRKNAKPKIKKKSHTKPQREDRRTAGEPAVAKAMAGRLQIYADGGRSGEKRKMKGDLGKGREGWWEGRSRDSICGKLVSSPGRCFLCF